ncbi:phosphate acetyltransferase [Halomonas cupida]|uniref:phosphate acetyltransferase n=1 Tax=Halomonas cupida TaxID=44933 RepID=UPI003A93D83D
MKALNLIRERARQAPKRIVLCEGDDERVLKAAVLAVERGYAEILMVGEIPAIQRTAEDVGVDLTSMTLIDPRSSPCTQRLVERLVALRAHKGMSESEAAWAVLDPLVFANLMVSEGLADGCVAGATHTTADVVRCALQLIGRAPGVSLVSSFFLMMLCKPFHEFSGGMIFSDCGLVVEPSDMELADIALAAAGSAEVLLDEPARVAMLSFSTGGSACHAAVDKVVRAARRVKAERPELAIDEDVQLDAAIVAEVSARKVPESRVKGRANVLIFPDLEAGNIGYKLAERLGGAEAIGPLLQGLARPANDLSRGCSIEDIVNVITVTTVQAQQQSADNHG